MRVCVARIAVAAVLFAASPARAEAPTVEVAAQVHLDRGVAAFHAGDYATAHRELRAAHELVPDLPNPYRWLAFTEVQLGDCRSALVNIDGFLSRTRPDDPRRAELRRLYELCAQTGVLAIASRPTGAALRIDGALVGTTPYRALSMRAGAHLIVAEHPGFDPAERSVVVPAAGQLAVTLELSPAVPARTSVVHRWWFWPAVAGAALVVAGGAYVLATRGDGISELPPITCRPTGCDGGS